MMFDHRFFELDICLLVCRSRSPQITEAGHQEIVHADITGNFPCEDQKDRDAEKDAVHACGASHNEVPVHETCDEGSDTSEDAEDQGNADHKYKTEGDTSSMTRESHTIFVV